MNIPSTKASNLRPISIVIGGNLRAAESGDICTGQHQSINSGRMKANSTQVMSQLSTDNIMTRGGIYLQGFDGYSIRSGVEFDTAAESIMKAVAKQMHCVSIPLFLCEVQTGGVMQADLEEAGDAEQ